MSSAEFVGETAPTPVIAIPFHRAALWGFYQLAALGLIGWLATEVFAPTAANVGLYAIIAAGLATQGLTTANLVRRTQSSPPILLWLSLALVGAAALGALLAPGPVPPAPADAAVAVLTLVFVLTYLTLWTSRAAVKGDEVKRWVGDGINLATAAHVTLGAALAIVLSRWGQLQSVAWQLVSLLGLIIVQPIAASWLQARLDKKLPVERNGEPNHKHISGLGVLTLVSSIVAIVILGVVTATQAYFTRDAGLIVVFGLTGAFLLVAVGPNLQAGDDVVHSMREEWIVKKIGQVLSFFDALLVFAVAGGFGAGQRRFLLRYFILISHVLAAALLGWWLPAPIGLIPLAWGFVCALAIARRWAWVEEDRENAMLNRRFVGSHIKVGFDQDLRDEALLSYASLLFLVPLALRQAHLALHGHLFVVERTADINDFMVWLTFFGIELSKAVPFIDWAEIYQVHGSAAIHVDDTSIGLGQHVVFATRVLIDLVLLATLVQAISVSQRAAKLKQMFYEDKTLDRLDPFTEEKAFRRLVTRDGDNFHLIDPVPEPFLGYDQGRLEDLAEQHGNDPAGIAATELLEKRQSRSPELLLLDEAKRPEPDSDKMLDLIDRIRGIDEPAIHDLEAAHYFLNASGKLRGVREEIVKLIAQKWRVGKAVSTLSDILTSNNNSVRDSRAEVRLIALSGLQDAAMNGNEEAYKVIAIAAGSDLSGKVKSAAVSWLATHPKPGSATATEAPSG
jgi:hypothetical protein